MSDSPTIVESIFQARVLVVAPHFDDESIGCGGTLLKFRRQLKRLAVAHLTGPSVERRSEFSRVKAALDVDAHYSLDHEDGFLLCSHQDVVRSLTQIIQIEQPELILIPHEKEEHSDHEAAARFSLDAAQKARFWSLPAPAMKHHITALVEYEVWTALDRPSLVCDISDTFEEKCALISSYSSQVKDFPYVEYVTALNGWRGILHNRGGQAEAFRLRAI